MTESGTTLTFPDKNYFRFQDCDAYRSLSGFHFKEMDACWYETSSDVYWLIELKDYRSANLKDAKGIESRAWDIVKKAVDTLNMFLACRHNYSLSPGFAACMNRAPAGATKLKVVSIIQCDHGQRADVQLLRDAFRSRFKAYALLFDIDTYTVVRHDQAVRLLPYNFYRTTSSRNNHQTACMNTDPS